MKSLVYDFGQLDTATEQEYTIKIVWKHVSHCSCEQIMLSLTDDIVPVIIMGETGCGKTRLCKICMLIF